MAKKRSRHQNHGPSLAPVDGVVKRKKLSKLHHNENKGMMLKILKEAELQKREVQEEEAYYRNPESLLFRDEEAEMGMNPDEEDIDDFKGFDTENLSSDFEEEIDEEVLELLEAFTLEDAGSQRAIANFVIQKNKEECTPLSSEVQRLPKFNDFADVYKKAGKILSTYTAGKLPKAFKEIPSLENWKELLDLTEPEKWSPNAMYQGTRLFSSNMGVKSAEILYNLFLLPRVREDIRKNKKLHFALYQALKKALFKPAAFYRGILFPLCESKTCTLREAVIIGSIIRKESISSDHSSVALLRLAEMEYCGTTSYLIKILIEKKYALAYRVLDTLVSHFLKFADDERKMPVIWHQSLLAFVQRYRNELTKVDKDNLKNLVYIQRHSKITPEIVRELNSSHNRHDKNADLETIASQISTVSSIIQKESWLDCPDVPMEADY